MKTIVMGGGCDASRDMLKFKCQHSDSRELVLRNPDVEGHPWPATLSRNKGGTQKDQLLIPLAASRTPWSEVQCQPVGCRLVRPQKLYSPVSCHCTHKDILITSPYPNERKSLGVNLMNHRFLECGPCSQGLYWTLPKDRVEELEDMDSEEEEDDQTSAAALVDGSVHSDKPDPDGGERGQALVRQVSTLT